MRYIVVPKAIAVKPPPEILGGVPDAASDPVSFRKWAFTIWLDDRRAIEGGFTQQVRWSKVVEAFETTLAGGVIALEDEDFRVLKAIVEKPERAAPATVSVQMIPFSRAVLDAPDKNPIEAAEPAVN